MTNLIINKLDYQRLIDRVTKAKADPNASFKHIRTLLMGVSQATLLEPTDIPADVVTMNSLVKIRYLDDQKTLNVRLVYPEQANIAQRQISIFAPLATALLGCKKGDQVSLSTPARTVKIQIDAILYQPEAAGDLAL
ncbi:GreA/GreB family elongation factor [Larkinella bovis]|uniref:GreA/GreB family elongation factor n=1 Tax=Larkinella bovis TaxID=683041 RepID=A0ABW0I9B0_9BACT